MLKRNFVRLKRKVTCSNSLSSSDILKLFELGYRMQERKHTDLALSCYAQTINLLESAINTSPKRLSEFAFAKIAFSHGVKLFRMNNMTLASKAFLRADEVLEIIQTNDVSMEVIELRASALHWLACCQRRTKEFSKAQVSYKKALHLVHGLLFFSTNLKRDSNHHIMLEALAIGYVKSLRTSEKRNRQASAQ